MMFWYGNGMSGWGYALMTVGMVLFWALLIAGIVLLVRAMGSGSWSAPPTAPGPTPEEMLAMRLARGEIDEDEYRRRLEAIRLHRPNPPVG